MTECVHILLFELMTILWYIVISSSLIIINSNRETLLIQGISVVIHNTLRTLDELKPYIPNRELC